MSVRLKAKICSMWRSMGVTPVVVGSMGVPPVMEAVGSMGVLPVVVPAGSTSGPLVHKRKEEFLFTQRQDENSR